MPIVGHGLDVVEIARIASLLNEHASRFPERCFTAAECAYADAAKHRRAERYAARFAAKEAVLKALGTGLRDGIRWTDIAVRREASGRPLIELDGRCLEVAAERGITRWHLTLSHVGEYAIASVVAESASSDASPSVGLTAHGLAGAGERGQVAVVTVSDTRTLETDVSGERVASLLLAAGHDVAARTIVTDDVDRIRVTLETLVENPDIDVIITTGGTGVARRDATVDVVRALLTNELAGFGELFRMVSFESIGSSAMLSRAVGGLAGDRPSTIVFALPGSPNAVETAMTRLILPELGHLLGLRQ